MTTPHILSRRDFGLGAALGVTGLLVSAPSVLAQAGLSAADQAVVARAQTYLRGLTSAQGEFVETGAGGQRRLRKGGISHGRILWDAGAGSGPPAPRW